MKENKQDDVPLESCVIEQTNESNFNSNNDNSHGDDLISLTDHQERWSNDAQGVIITEKVIEDDRASSINAEAMNNNVVNDCSNGGIVEYDNNNKLIECSDEDSVGSFVPLVCYSMLISMGGFIFGYDIGTIGGLVDLSSFTGIYGNSNINGVKSFKPVTKGTIVSISCLGGFISGLIVNKLLPLMGMRFTIFVSMASYVIGNFIILLSENWKVIVVARIFNGIAIGITQITCPMFISEITPIKQRGIFTCFNQLFTTFGIVVGSITILFSATQYYPSDNAQFQYPLCQGIVLASIGGGLIWLLPESPNWLVKNGSSIDKVKDSLRKIRSLSIDDERLTNLTVKTFDLNRVVVKTNEKDDFNNSRSILYGKPRYFIRTLVGVCLLGFQQFTGINFFFYYGLIIFENVELNTPYLVPVIFGIVNLIFSGLSIFIISIFQRRVLLISGSTLLTILMILFTICGTILGNSLQVTVSLIIISCLFISVFSLTWGPIASVIISELFPTNIKVKAMSICGSSAWIFNFTISLIIPILASKIGLALGSLFAIITMIGAIFVYYLIPETKHVTTNTLDEKYRKSIFVN